MAVSSRIFLVALLLAAGLLARPAAAAESYDNCTGFIDSLPATISTQGVWCLDKNLGTAITSGSAITIANNNVTIDCNDFKIGGLAAGDASKTYGIYADSRQNAVVRHCNVRGFYTGVFLSGGAGHLVEDNRFDNNLSLGISVSGYNSVVRENLVYDTGGAPGESFSVGIFTRGHVIDNTVNGVFATATNTHPAGIQVYGVATVARDNRVSGLQVSGSGNATGIIASGAGVSVDGNYIAAPSGTAGWGIYGQGTTKTACGNNVIAGLGLLMVNCADAGGNIALTL